jgi:hypothetical protein
VRLESLGLLLHPGKTKIVYCKDANRGGSHEHTSFTLLGYEFRPRSAENRNGLFNLTASAASGGSFSTTSGTTAVAGARVIALPSGGDVVRTGATTSYYFEVPGQQGTSDLELDSTAQNPAWRQYTPYGAPAGRQPPGSTTAASSTSPPTPPPA